MLGTSSTTRTAAVKTDSQLLQEVLAELKWKSAAHVSQIGVDVKAAS